jgi:hypothetical protein
MVIITKKIVIAVMGMVLLNVVNVMEVETYSVVLVMERELPNVKSVKAKVKLIVEETW